MQEPYSVRTAEDTDGDALCAFYREVCRAQEDLRCGPDWHWGVYPSEEGLRDQIRKNEMVLVMQKETGRIAAAAAALRHADPRYGKGHWRIKAPSDKVITLHLLAVHPDFRGEGLGGMLLDWISEQGRKEGFLSVQLDILKGNLPAARLYEKNGFVFVGETLIRYEDTGENPVEFYEKDLRRG